MPGSDSSADKKSFLIGVGSQRAGSTLLFKILARSAQGLFMHPIKELHYFDTLFKIRPARALKDYSNHRLDHLQNKHGAIEGQERISSFSKSVQCEIRANRLLANAKVEQLDYIDLFRPCVMHYQWLGEVTPEYMLMNSDQLVYLRDQLGPKIYCVMVIRNPLKRFLSAFKLRHAYMKPAGEEPPSNECLLEDLKLNLVNNDGWLRCQMRFNQYAEAIDRFRNVFGENFLFFSLDEVVSNVQGVIGSVSMSTGLNFDIDLAKRVVSKKINETGVNLSLDDDTLGLCSDFFGPSIQAANSLVDHPLKL